MVRGRDLGQPVHKVGSIYLQRGFQRSGAGFRDFRLIFPQVDGFLRGFKKKFSEKNQNINIFQHKKKVQKFPNSQIDLIDFPLHLLYKHQGKPSKLI